MQSDSLQAFLLRISNSQVLYRLEDDIQVATKAVSIPGSHSEHLPHHCAGNPTTPCRQEDRPQLYIGIPSLPGPGEHHPRAGGDDNI